MEVTVEEKYVIDGEVVDFLTAIGPLRVFVKKHTDDKLDMFFADAGYKVIDKCTIEASSDSVWCNVSISCRLMNGKTA